MPIYLASSILPRNGNSYFLMDDVYLRGGFQVRVDAADRDSIMAMNRKAGMLVLTQDDGKIWVLQPDLTSWEELKTGVGGVGGVAGARQTATHTTIPLNNDQWDDFSLALGKTITLINLSVDRECMVEIFGTPTRMELNPYKFVATKKHLSDDGTTFLSDGTQIYGRRYSILSNVETTPTNQLYFRLYNPGLAAPDGITLNLEYLLLE